MELEPPSKRPRLDQASLPSPPPTPPTTTKTHANSLFAPFRLIGLITTATPFSLDPHGRKVVTSLGVDGGFAEWDLKELKLRGIGGGDGTSDRGADWEQGGCILAGSEDQVFVGDVNRVKRFRRGKQVKEIGFETSSIN
jgi:hypothetical protein